MFYNFLLLPLNLYYYRCFNDIKIKTTGTMQKLIIINYCHKREKKALFKSPELISVPLNIY